MEAITWSLWVVLALWSVGGIFNLMALFTTGLNINNLSNLQAYLYVPAPLVLLDYLLG
jgi:hypothetical protein